MLKKSFLTLFFIIFSCIPAYSHDFSRDTIDYMYTNPDATWSEFYGHVLGSNDTLLKSEIQDSMMQVSIALSLPGNDKLWYYAEENPNFSYSDVVEFIEDDPMLSELGADNIYNFLISQYADQRNIPVDFSFFLRTIFIGLIHIIGGYDHILFLITLIVCLPRIARILGIISTFTIAHCITLILGGLGIITLPGIIVESMILISIIIMAIYAIFTQVGTQKNIYFETLLIFILGLFHGLGFAGFFAQSLVVHTNIIFPVLGFNIGVEIGQILIMILSIGILSLLYTYTPNKKNSIKNALASICIIAALYWLITSFL